MALCHIQLNRRKVTLTPGIFVAEVSTEDRDASPIHYGSRERKRAILKQHIVMGYKYAIAADFPFIANRLAELLKGFD
jgi:hypothetical protein